MKRVSIPTPMNLFLLVCLLLTTLPSAFAQSDLSGYWNFRVPNDDGTFRETYFELQQKGETLTGRLFGRTPQGTPLEGTIKNGAILFATVPPAGGAPANSFGGRPIVYDGSYQDGKLLLETHGFRGQLVKGEAIRTTREAAIPAPLPLPVLRDLPDNGLVPTPPMGWNSWNKFAGKITADDVRGMADAMVASGMNKLGYVYINIDDTWEGGRDANGNIITNRKFPDMKALADYVHFKGLNIGI
jgi:alpha-galactosidase